MHVHEATAGPHGVAKRHCVRVRNAELVLSKKSQLVLEILTETGSIGLLLWLAGVVLAWRAWRSVGAAARERAFPVSLALGVMLFPLNTHLAFYSAWWGLLFAWLLGLWCAGLFVAGIPAGEEEPGIRAGLPKQALPREGHDGA